MAIAKKNYYAWGKFNDAFHKSMSTLDYETLFKAARSLVMNDEHLVHLAERFAGKTEIPKDLITSSLLEKEWYLGYEPDDVVPAYRTSPYTFKGGGIVNEPVTVYDPFIVFIPKMKWINKQDGLLTDSKVDCRGGKTVSLATIQLILEAFFTKVSDDVVNPMPVDYEEAAPVLRMGASGRDLTADR